MIVTQTMVLYVKWDGGAQEIPVQFLRETKLHIPTNGEISWIALVDSSNKLWQVLSKQVVECNKQQQNRLQLSPEGWANFALDHILEEGDACVFELLYNSKELPMFRVHIFQALLPTLDDDDTSKLVIADRLCQQQQSLFECRFWLDITNWNGYTVDCYICIMRANSRWL